MSSPSALIHRAAVIFVDVAVLSLAGLLTFYLFQPAEPRERERSSTRKKDRAAALVREMLQKQNGGRSEKTATNVRLNDYEIELVAGLPPRPQVGVSFANIGGLAEQVGQIRRALLLPLEKPHLFTKTKLLRPPKGLLLHGAPGTGKTMLARAVANEAKFTFLCLDPARLLSKWYGESNKMAEAYFTLAHKLAPSIIFIDEIDCLFPRQRGAGEHEATAALRSQFLSLWDGILSPRNGRASSGHVVLIGATNRAENIDEAILRRMPFSIEVPMPDEAGRADVLTRMLRDEAMARELDISALARECAGYSGSDLEALCSTAAMRPLDELLAREKAAEGAVDGGRAGNEEVPEGRGAAVGVAQPPGVQEEARGSGSGDGGVRDAGSAGAAETSGGEGEASALGVEETNGQRGIALASDIESELCAPTNGNVAGVNAGRAASSAGAAETSGGQGGVSASGTLEANGKKGVSSASGTAASNGKGKVAAVTDTTNGKGGVLLGKAVASAHGTEEELRPLTMDDFRAAMLVVRSSGNRFSRPPALVGASEHTGDVDWDLYD